jgi:hypothetical protein
MCRIFVWVFNFSSHGTLVTLNLILGTLDHFKHFNYFLTSVVWVWVASVSTKTK